MINGKKPPTGGWKLDLHSDKVMAIWFTDGNVRTMYSLDWKTRYSPYDTFLGEVRFQKLIAKYGDKAGYVLISKNDNAKAHLRTIIKAFQEGKEITVTDMLREKVEGYMKRHHQKFDSKLKK